MCNKTEKQSLFSQEVCYFMQSYQTSFHRKYVVYFGIPRLKVLVISFLVIASPIFFCLFSH